MAITPTNLLNNFDNGDRTTYNLFGSFTPSAGQMLVCRITQYGNSAATNTPTLTDSAGHTWTLRNTGTVGARTLSVYTAPDNGVYSASTPTVTYGAAGVIGVHITVDGFTGVDTATNDGVVQSQGAGGSGTTATVTLAAFGSASNATVFYASMALNSATSSNNLTNATGYPVESGGTTPSQDSFAGVQLSPNTTPNAVWASGNWMAVGLELKAAGGASDAGPLVGAGRLMASKLVGQGRLARAC